MCDPNGSNQATPALSSASTVLVSTLALVCNCTPVCSSFNDQAAEQQTWQSFAAARHFCSAKILAGGLRWGWGPRRSRQRHRPRKEISRGNLLCAVSGLPDLSYPRLAVAQKYVTTPDWLHVRVGQPRGARGTAVPLFREESRGTPFKGFLWATSSRRLDPALLFADKKRGVETYQAGRVLPVNPRRLPPRTAETYSSSCSGSMRSIEMTRLPSSTLMRMTPCVSLL